MTSHNLDRPLPFVEAGMIWDGVTEYQNGEAPWSVGLIYLSACTETAPDGSANSWARDRR